MSALRGWHTSRGSSSIGAPGLFVIALGAFVLLSGLSTPAPETLDMISGAGTSIPAVAAVVPQWLGGLGMVAVALLGLGARKRVHRLIQYAAAFAGV
jgi:hypothetical protein